MKVIKPILKNLEGIVATIALTIMIILTCTNIGLRYFFNASNVALSEYSVMCMTWAVFLGTAEAYKRNLHFGMDFLTNHLPKKYRMIQRQILILLLTVLFAVLTYHSAKFAFNTTKRTAAIQISYFWIDLPAALCFFSMTCYSILDLYQSVFRKELFYKRYEDTDALIDIGFEEKEAT